MVDCETRWMRKFLQTNPQFLYTYILQETTERMSVAGDPDIRVLLRSFGEGDDLVTQEIW